MGRWVFRLQVTAISLMGVAQILAFMEGSLNFLNWFLLFGTVAMAFGLYLTSKGAVVGTVEGVFHRPVFRRRRVP